MFEIGELVRIQKTYRGENLDPIPKAFIDKIVRVRDTIKKDGETVYSILSKSDPMEESEPLSWIPESCLTKVPKKNGKIVFNDEDFPYKSIMQCKTPYEAERFLEVVGSLGYKWRGGQEFSDNTEWEDYKENTCYQWKDGTYCGARYFEETESMNCDYWFWLSSEEFIFDDSIDQWEDEDSLDDFFKSIIDAG